MSEQQDAQEMLTYLRAALDEEQAEQRPASLQGTQPSWTEQLWGVMVCATRQVLLSTGGTAMRSRALSVLRAQQLIIEQCHVTYDCLDVNIRNFGPTPRRGCPKESS